MSVEKAAATHCPTPLGSQVTGTQPLVLGANPSEETPSDTSSVQIDPIHRDSVRAAVALLAYADHGRCEELRTQHDA